MLTGRRRVSKTAYLRLWSVHEMRVNGVLCYPLCLNYYLGYRGGSLVFFQAFREGLSKIYLAEERAIHFHFREVLFSPCNPYYT
jgi:hypothetical protein